MPAPPNKPSDASQARSPLLFDIYSDDADQTNRRKRAPLKQRRKQQRGSEECTSLGSSWEGDSNDTISAGNSDVNVYMGATMSHSRPASPPNVPPAPTVGAAEGPSRATPSATLHAHEAAEASQALTDRTDGPAADHAIETGVCAEPIDKKIMTDKILAFFVLNGFDIFEEDAGETLHLSVLNTFNSLVRRNLATHEQPGETLSYFEMLHRIEQAAKAM